VGDLPAPRLWILVIAHPPGLARLTRRLFGLLAVGITIAVMSGCSPTAVTPQRLQVSMAQTFSNLYMLQQVQQGNPRPDPKTLRTTASCLKGTPATVQNGAGNDWVCDVTYLVAGPSTPVTAIYNVNVQTDGCYAADGDGPASVNGSRTITGPHYQQVVNPLWLIDGCFDTT
jgi:ABC-2 type transport system permease protein